MQQLETTNDLVPRACRADPPVDSNEFATALVSSAAIAARLTIPIYLNKGYSRSTPNPTKFTRSYDNNNFLTTTAAIKLF
jgi:hypothetical protein